jgi:glutamate N-acetyltransferase/amino-acid N-acetyltransferase
MSARSWEIAGGYSFAGVHSGLRSEAGRRDLAMIASDRAAAAAGVFTQIRIVAAPVQLCRQRVPASSARGIVVCSGNANACTGARGLHDAQRMAAVAADAVGCKPEQILVCSTGIIGRHLPMEVIEPGIRLAHSRLEPTPAALDAAAHAILTTDTRIKIATRAVTIGDRLIHLTGLAKGAAMIGPDMATMLAFVLTDAAVAPDSLQALLRRAADRSFNCISVEGHTSTNDTLLLLANGAAGGAELQGPDLEKYESAVTEVCADLARAIADDAEGMSHLIRLEVEGMRSESEARRVAKAVAESALVKAAVFGADPNWGRVVSAAANAGVDFEEHDFSLWMGPTLLYDRGVPQPFDSAAASAYLKNNREVAFRLVFALGRAGCRFWTCDLTYEYVRLNAEYTT